MKRTPTLGIWLAVLTFALALAGSAFAAPLAQDGTPTPNATERMQTAQAIISTPDFSTAIKYGDIMDISVLLGIGLIIAILFMAWLALTFLSGPRVR